MKRADIIIGAGLAGQQLGGSKLAGHQVASWLACLLNALTILFSVSYGTPRSVIELIPIA